MKYKMILQTEYQKYRFDDDDDGFHFKKWRIIYDVFSLCHLNYNIFSKYTFFTYKLHITMIYLFVRCFDLCRSYGNMTLQTITRNARHHCQCASIHANDFWENHYTLVFTFRCALPHSLEIYKHTHTRQV